MREPSSATRARRRDAPRGLLFVGGFEHPPNTDAAVTLVRDVMPLVWRELGPVPVTIVGADPPAEVQALAGPEVDVAGWVEDLPPLYDSARVMVAPLRYGAGMKGKVTQSLAAGLPVVTTPVGAEGLGAVDGRDMLIAEDPAGLAERGRPPHPRRRAVERPVAGGQEVAARVFSPAVMRERLEELLVMAAERQAPSIERQPPPDAEDPAVAPAARPGDACAVAIRAGRGHRGRSILPPVTEYEDRVGQELAGYDEVEEVHQLPPIYHYWSERYVLPLLHEVGFESIDRAGTTRSRSSARREHRRMRGW